MTPSRRTVLGGGALLTFARPLAAQISATDEVVALWPGAPPGSRGTITARRVEDQSQDPAHPDRWVTGIAQPVLIVRRPARANGSAVLVVPGGGYAFLSYDNEGTSQAAWLNARGITAFILMYRLPGEGWDDRSDVPLQDAQRAMRLIRSRAADFGVRADRLAVVGFSAGGHLAGLLATHHARAVYAPVDSADGQSARPDLAALVYPVISLYEPYTHAGSRDQLLGAEAMLETRRRYSVEHCVDANTPPTFLVHAADDGLVPPANSIAMFGAMTDAKRPVALHIFEDGGHGFGSRLPADRSAMAWPTLFMTFAARHGLLG